MQVDIQASNPPPGRVAGLASDDKHRCSKSARDVLTLLAGVGVEGDAHAGPLVRHRYLARRHPLMPNLRPVHLVPSELLEAPRTEGYELAPGDLGENVLTSGVALASLPLGALLKIGAATIELTGLRTPCVLIERFKAGLQRKLIASGSGRPPYRCGVMGVVRSGGAVAVGDTIDAEFPTGPLARPARAVSRRNPFARRLLHVLDTEIGMTDRVRRGVLKGAAAAGSLAAMRFAAAQQRTDEGTRELDGKPMPEPPAARSAGPISAGRGTMLQDKVAVVTGAARGIGRAIAVEMAANGADVVVVDIAGVVSSASNAKPATAEELAETVRMIRSFGRRSQGIKADIRDIGALRTIADQVERDYGRIDIVVANAAIQRWMPLLAMEDTSSTTTSTALQTPCARLLRRWWRATKAASSCCRRCKASTAPRMQRAIRPQNGEYLA